MRARKPAWQRKIARERIAILFSLAEREVNKNPKRARRYIELMRKIGKRYNVRLPKKIKGKFCKFCNTPLKPGRTAKVRIDSRRKVLIVRCLYCKKVYRYPYK